jgi:hypothetical protein
MSRIQKVVCMTHKHMIMQEHAEILNVQCLEVVKQNKWESVSYCTYNQGS